MWEHKVGNNANIADFVWLWKARINTRIFQDVSENLLGSSGAKYLFQILAKNKVLVSLQAQGNDFNENDAKYVYAALKVSRKNVLNIF